MDGNNVFLMPCFYISVSRDKKKLLKELFYPELTYQYSIGGDDLGSTCLMLGIVWLHSYSLAYRDSSC